MYRHNFLCHRDFASKVVAALLFTDFSEGADWKATSIRHEDFVADVGDDMPVLGKAPGWRIERTRGDTMHCTNLGVCFLLIGNCLKFLVDVKVHISLHGDSPLTPHPVPPRPEVRPFFPHLHLDKRVVGFILSPHLERRPKLLATKRLDLQWISFHRFLCFPIPFTTPPHFQSR